MRSSSTITLFAPPPQAVRSDSAAVVVSMALHVVAYGWLLFGLKGTPRLVSRPSNQHFTVRILNAPSPEPPQAASSAPSVAHLSAPPALHAPAFHAPTPAAPAPAPAASPAAMPAVATLAQLKPKTQILIQPDAPPDIMIQHPVLVPNILRWTAPAIPTKTIVPPPPQKPIIANLRPRIDPPNRELTPAEIKMSSTPYATTLPALPPSTTTPIVVHGPDPAKRIPETASKQTEQPTPAQIMSISNLQVKEGPVEIPLANSPARPAIRESAGTGPSVNSAGTGQGGPPNSPSATGTGHSPAPSTNKGAAGSPAGTQAANNNTSGPAQTTKNDGAPGTGQAAKSAAPTGAGQSAKPDAAPGASQGQSPGVDLAAVVGGPVTQIHRAKDGQYGVVVVGQSIAEEYPETVGLWGGRLVYTVYVHMSSGKPWILQYALPPNAPTAGSVRPDAPWPFDIVQPHLDPSDYTSDALMVHGFVNVAGRFDRLAVVFPSDFAKAKFLLSALQQWQFRPGRQNGQLAAVEVLLIIPDEE